jgi:hypothetical protein
MAEPEIINDYMLIPELEKIAQKLKKEGGCFTLGYDPDRSEWTTAMEWGKEASDSPMAGAAAYGVSPDLSTAVGHVVREAGL